MTIYTSVGNWPRYAIVPPADMPLCFFRAAYSISQTRMNSLYFPGLALIHSSMTIVASSRKEALLTRASRDNWCRLRRRGIQLLLYSGPGDTVTGSSPRVSFVDEALYKGDG